MPSRTTKSVLATAAVLAIIAPRVYGYYTDHVRRQNPSALSRCKGIPCARLARHLAQYSGTCYFNTALNLMLLNPGLNALLRARVAAYVASLPPPQRAAFLEAPPDLRPAKWRRVHVWKLLHVLLHGRGKLDAALAHNLPRHLVFATGVKRRRQSHEGGDEVYALQNLCKWMGISFAYGELEPGDRPDVFVGHEEHVGRFPLRIRHGRDTYALDGACVGVEFRRSTFGRVEGHAVTGTWCGKRAVVYDSAANQVVPYDWVANEQPDEGFVRKYMGWRAGFFDPAVEVCPVYVRL